MKNIFIPIIVAFILVASCSKKKDESPAPAPLPVQPTAEKKLEAPSSRPTTVLGSGTVRETPVDITVSATEQVTVAAPQIMRVNMEADPQTDLNKLTGAGANLRTEGTSTENKYYGWFVHDININGVVYTGYDQMRQYNFAKVYFFNIDAPGIYYIHDYNTSQWSWGTWAVDKDMKYVAFNVETNGIYNNLWKTSCMTKDRLVLSIYKDVTGDGKPDNVAIGLNGYDLKSNNNNGQLVINKSEQKFLGTWSYFSVTDSNQTARTFYPTNIYIYSDGKALAETTYPNGIPPYLQYSNWAMEDYPDPNYPDYAILVTTYYENGLFYWDKYVTYIQDTYMYFKVIDSSNPANVSIKGYVIGMVKN